MPPIGFHRPRMRRYRRFRYPFLHRYPFPRHFFPYYPPPWYRFPMGWHSQYNIVYPNRWGSWRTPHGDDDWAGMQVGWTMEQ